MSRSRLAASVTAILALTLMIGGAGSSSVAIVLAQDDPLPPPENAKFDYQIGGDYKLPPGVTVVSRDWFSGQPPADPAIYTICYVNAFQTQANEPGVDRPDEQNNWPKKLVLTKLGDDPNWGGEYLIDISTGRKRRQAARWVRQMIEGCDDKGFDAVEFDNLDSWTRFNGTPLAKKVPFERAEAVRFAALLVDIAHELGLAAGQKNTTQLRRSEAIDQIGFDFAIAEECGRYNECQRYRDLHDNRVIVIEYRQQDFKKSCQQFGDVLSVVLRDVNVSTPKSKQYVYRAC